MNYANTGFPRMFRLSGLLLLFGLATEAISLLWVHPIAFIVFVVVGGTLIAAGVLLFLYSLVSYSSAQNSQDSELN